jgi:predicted DNA-binding protein (UPF0278 family)
LWASAFFFAISQFLIDVQDNSSKKKSELIGSQVLTDAVRILIWFTHAHLRHRISERIVVPSMRSEIKEFMHFPLL